MDKTTADLEVDMENLSVKTMEMFDRVATEFTALRAADAALAHDMKLLNVELNGKMDTLLANVNGSLAKSREEFAKHKLWIALGCIGVIITVAGFSIKIISLLPINP